MLLFLYFHTQHVFVHVLSTILTYDDERPANQLLAQNDVFLFLNLLVFLRVHRTAKARINVECRT